MFTVVIGIITLIVYIFIEIVIKKTGNNSGLLNVITCLSTLTINLLQYYCRYEMINHYESDKISMAE